jgi:exonuclease VII small subunit
MVEQGERRKKISKALRDFEAQVENLLKLVEDLEDGDKA